MIIILIHFLTINHGLEENYGDMIYRINAIKIFSLSTRYVFWFLKTPVHVCSFLDLFQFFC